LPLSKHFQGHGAEVMSSMRAAHPDYSQERLNAEFYATENKQKGGIDHEIGRTIKHIRRRHKLARTLEK
jgi:hypothetical protein